MPTRRGLGKGLDALIPRADNLGGVEQVAIEAILPNPRQPRRDFDASELEGLAASIRKHGVLQPLIVTPEPDSDKYRLIAGERRLQAARMVGLGAVPVIVRSVSDQERLELALIENLQRTDLNPLEAAEGYRQLTEDFSLSHEEVAARVGKTRTSVSNTLRLLKLGDPARQALAEGRISEGHARALLGLTSGPSQTAALGVIESRQLNVRQTEALVRRLAGERRPARKRRSKSPEETDLEAQLRQALGTRVILRRSGKGGSLVIRFYSDEELNALLDRLLDGSSGD
jgi:ParB family chromosome partitioning protein